MGMVLSEISLSDTFNHAHGVSMHMGERCVTHWVRGTFAPFRFSIVPRLMQAGNFFAKDLVVSEKLPIFATDILTFNFLSIWKQRKRKGPAKR